MKRNTSIKIILLAVVVIGLFVLYNNEVTLESEALSAAELGGEYLVRVTGEDGRFMYEVDASSGRSLGGYNMLRHAGTTYSMLELYGETGDENLLAAAERALEYLKSQTETCYGFTEGVRCVLDGRKVKLGGNGLAILAYTKHAEVTGSDEYLNEAESLARWITEIQSSEGEFEVHIEFIDTGELDDHISLYYPGEAIFALARLYEARGDERWLESAQGAADWLITVRDRGKSPEDLPHDHWLLYGLRELYEAEHNELYLNHTKALVRAIVDAQNKDYTGAQSVWNGGYFENPRTTPAATRTEGLVAAYELFKEAGETESTLAAETMLAIEEGLDFVMRAQITESKVRSLGGHTGTVGGFPESLTGNNIRTDFVQHSISALLGYKNL
jgi:hypothetical protein